jgi:hypothetical protein
MQDALPSVKGIQYILWLAALVTIVLRRHYTIAIACALGAGVCRRAGKPELNKEFLQRAMF